MYILNMLITEATLITIIGMTGGGVGTLLVYFLKSRCTEIECCCMKCKRDVLAEVSATLSPPRNTSV